MSKFTFSTTSQDRLKTCHKDLQVLAKAAIEISEIDFGIAEGYRSPEDQMKAYKAGRSKIDGVRTKSKHNYDPALAFDIYAFKNGRTSYDAKDMCYLGGLIMATAKFLKSSGKIRSEIRWGGNWDGDGVIVTDQTLVDLPHFEIKG
ncbi:MAG: M15 family peptidase [Bacteroidetes bacterium]|nr:M15 family peptidase [Bacteroidota bacterium]